MNLPDVAATSSLFAGIEETQLESLLACLSAVRRTYRKGEFVFMAGEKPVSVGLVLSGGVKVVQDDFWGHRMILAHVQPGGLFAEAFSCADKERLPVSVVAAEATDVLLIDMRKVVTTCSSSCVFHTRLIRNMLRVVAEKNILLTQKMEHLSKRTMREKLLSFLSSQAVQRGSREVVIPFNRQELADYLCVDRSALSRELGVMQTEGLLACEKNRFTLLRGQDG